ADIETAEMVRWLQEPTGGDVRVRLRRALHASTVYEQFHSVLIDCPPRLTTTCITALAARDYVQIPLLRDRTSTEHVPILLKWLSQLHSRGVCEHLKAVAVLANRTYENEDERQAWKELPEFCNAELPFRLEFLKTEISHNRYYTQAARGRYPAVLRRRQEFN